MTLDMKPRILVYRNLLFPISETFVLNQTMHLSRYEAHVLGAKLQKGASIAFPEERMYLVNQDGVQGWLREFGWKVLGHVPEDVFHWARQLRPALIHAHFAPDGAMAMAKRLGLPLIVSFHGTDATMKDGHVWRHSYMTHRLYLLRRRRLAHVASRIIAQSEFLRNIVVFRHGFPTGNVVIIRHGIDLNQFQAVGNHTEWGHVLYVGRLIERKGLHYLIRALGKARVRFPEVHLTVIGDGPKREEYEAMAARELGHDVTFLGMQPQRVVQDYMQRAYVFCMPSITMPSGEAESLGVVFLEAMATKVPVVSFSSGGIPEVVLHEKTGFLAEERDVEGLAYYLSTLLENLGLRNEMGEAGRKWVEQAFNLEKQNAKLEALYDEVIAEHARLCG